MNNLARLSIEKPLYSWMLVLACVVGGLVGINTVGRLEDPSFPLSFVYVITPYEGASALEVEQEVTDPIEAALQELPYIEKITSKSISGRSEVMVELLEQYSEEDIPQIFDELRRRISEASLKLPPGAGPTIVEDDFGDIYGIMYAISAQDYSPDEIHDIARHLSTELKSVEHVAKVQVAGLPREAVYVEIDSRKFARLGLPIDSLLSRFVVENQVFSSGTFVSGDRRLRIAPKMAFDEVEAIGRMRIGRPGSTEILDLADVAKITRQKIEVPEQIIRHEGKEVFTVGVSVVPGQNVVDVGKEVDAKIKEVERLLPLGVEVATIYAQHTVVEQSIRQFLLNLILSVLTVIAALCIFMGWRAGTVVGAGLLLTVLGTICIMSLVGIELQRISLGAMMIAMGMLVDNGIVVAEGMVIGVRRGLSPADAASRSVSRTQFALLGATIIGIMAFGPISLSNDAGGHFLRSLFQVIAISLLLSWVLAITVIPLFGSYLLRAEKAAVNEEDLYKGVFYGGYRALLGFGLRRTWITTILIIGITGACIYSAQYMKQAFFPQTNSPLFYVDHRLPEGSDIHATEREVIDIERLISEYEGIESVTSFVGRGATRFTTIMQPEQPNPAYAQIVVRVSDLGEMDRLMKQIDSRLQAEKPDAEVQVTRAEFTSGSTSKFEARFLGPDNEVLRDLADQALDIYLEHNLIDRKIDWRQPALKLVPQFNESRARVAGISRADLSQSLAYGSQGISVGIFRDADKVIPIIARAPLVERGDVDRLMDRLAWSPTQQTFVPISQIVSKFELEAEDATIFRLDRFRTVQAQANPPKGYNFNLLFNEVRGQVEAIRLPAGYRMEWGGEYEANTRAYEVINQKIPFALLIMFLITILMFGTLRQPIVIWLTVPMTFCGVVLGLLITDLSFTFPSFLGFLSLSGMLIKNCIVLVDEIDKRFSESGMTLAVMTEASVSRLRPVILAAGTTIAGMSPLLGDAFFKEMAVCIMSGLAFATLLTLLAVPVFYRIALGRKLDDKSLSTE